MKYFFGGNAACAILALALITIFLFREGAGFFPQNLHGLRIYRQAGLEYVDIMRAQEETHTTLSAFLQDIRQRQLNLLLKTMTPEPANVALADFDRFVGEFDEAITDLRGIVFDSTDVVSAIKEKVKIAEDAKVERQMLVRVGKREDAERVNIASIDLAREIQPVLATFPLYQETNKKLREKIDSLVSQMPTMPSAAMQLRMTDFRRLALDYVATFPSTEEKLRTWDFRVPVPWYRAISSFLFGPQWITNSFWQDWFGLLPLLAGSLMISVVALGIAVPLGLCAAIYVNEVANPLEQRFIKPYIEFISAIPSVVLGFFGIAVFGETVRWLSGVSFLSWVPFFPISERLNVFTAGCLLALMAVPTIFSLSEDALNNVPRAFKEASYALGSTRLQTIVRILVPASLSGIISAVLLGFGRVIGETMVVLLCAGNRIAIPDFSQGLGIFQPVHTMTGIIAQEMGEVVRGSIHYRALFMVGVLLFALSLLINWAAQAIVRRYRISIG